MQFPIHKFDCLQLKQIESFIVQMIAPYFFKSNSETNLFDYFVISIIKINNVSKEQVEWFKNLFEIKFKSVFQYFR